MDPCSFQPRFLHLKRNWCTFELSGEKKKIKRMREVSEWGGEGRVRKKREKEREKRVEGESEGGNKVRKV